MWGRNLFRTGSWRTGMGNPISMRKELADNGSATEPAGGIHSVFARLRRGYQPMAHHELREELDAALAQVSDPLRQAVILRYLEGHSQEEAARQAGCTQVTLGWRAMKGLERLRTIL